MSFQSSKNRPGDLSSLFCNRLLLLLNNLATDGSNHRGREIPGAFHRQLVCDCRLRVGSLVIRGGGSGGGDTPVGGPGYRVGREPVRAVGRQGRSSQARGSVPVDGCTACLSSQHVACLPDRCRAVAVFTACVNRFAYAAWWCARTC